MTSSKPAKTLFAARPAVSICQRLLTAMPPTGKNGAKDSTGTMWPQDWHTSRRKNRSAFFSIYAMGNCADDILATFSIVEETVSFADIMTELNNCFGARRNIVVE